jgi:hypothetical protein
MNHGDVDPCFAALAEGFVVFAQAARAAQPTEGPLHDPPLRQHDEALLPRSARDDLDRPVPEPSCPLDELAPVRRVRPDLDQPRETAVQPAQHEFRPLAILDMGRMHHRHQQQPQRIDQDVPLASVYLLAGIVTSRPPFSVVFTDWLSRMAALGVGSLPAFVRTCSRSAS